MRRVTLMASPTPADPVAADVNARIRAQADRFGIGPGEPVKFVCECGCLADFSTTLSAYDAATTPVFAPGHPLRKRWFVDRLADRVRLRRRSMALH